MKALLIILLGLYVNASYAQELDTTKVASRTKELDEVVVKASYLSRGDDHIIAMPTKEQRKHAVTGYDLLNNLMIPGISVDRLKGIVATPAGNATLYIDGRQVDFREIQSLRPKDISRVEFYLKNRLPSRQTQGKKRLSRSSSEKKKTTIHKMRLYVTIRRKS